MSSVAESSTPTKHEWLSSKTPLCSFAGRVSVFVYKNYKFLNIFSKINLGGLLKEKMKKYEVTGAI